MTGWPLYRKTTLLILFVALDAASLARAQYATHPLFNQSIKAIDSVEKTNGTAKAFCHVYCESMKQIVKTIPPDDSNYYRIAGKFVASFSRLFLEAQQAADNGTLDKGSAWYPFFSHPHATSWQLILAGVNAHINADMWHSLVESFDGRQIKLYRKKFLAAQKAMTSVFVKFFDTLHAQSGLYRMINSLTWNLPIWAGKKLVNKWRHRQVKLAILFYKDPVRFKRLEKRVNTKKRSNDKWVLERLASI